MNIDDIKNIDDFQVYSCTKNEQRYIYSDMVENATPIADCIDLFIVPGTRSMNNISLCTKLRFLSINNYNIGKKELSNLWNYKENLSTITHLYLWNTKLNDLSLLQLFPNLTHLMVAYIRKEDFSFDGIGYTPNLHTLCILSANKIVNMDFIPNDLKKQIKNLSLEYASRLHSLKGIDGFENLERLYLFASTTESKKIVNLTTLSGLETLKKLKNIEFRYYDLDLEDVKTRLSSNPDLRIFKVNNINIPLTSQVSC
ncbi:leucine-rich repeat domain-containing protein [Bacteroides cellulosilyticus]|jgi:hypothetical protein|uniref:hypothetical protein n=1 Tax=Bacteroides cellulosilyticus TaxID=246787 RepID=UPI0029545453|nr:hypothetical protein [Bacteroides cellulosilyticus]MDV7048594.1 hypothetical protein [Bacteroides cellulosilyticus]